MLKLRKESCFRKAAWKA